MATLKDYRTRLGLSLEEAAVALGYASTSASWISEIENGKRDASLRLALRIQNWSGGEVLAGSVCKELADHVGGSGSDPANVNGLASEDAENRGENVSRTEGVAA